MSSGVRRVDRSVSARFPFVPNPVLSPSPTALGAMREPSDEMLRLIADLKAERDELRRFEALHRWMVHAYSRSREA
jgi:hypothetical protein